MIIPAVERGHPDYYRFDNPSSIAAASRYAMPHWQHSRIVAHLRLSHDYGRDIHRIINLRALFQYADRSPQEHKYRRLLHAEEERLRRQPLTMNQQAIARMDVATRHCLGFCRKEPTP